MVSNKIRTVATGVILSIAILLSSCGAATSLTVITFPEDAAVSIDGSPVEAPVQGLEINPGTHDVIATKMGYLPGKMTILVEEGRDNTFNIKLTTERLVEEVIKPGIPDNGFRIRTVPDTTNSICYIRNIKTGTTQTFDLEETPITGDWNKILPLAGFDKSTDFDDVAGIAVCYNNDDEYGVCTVGTGTDAIFPLKKINWRKNTPDWDFISEDNCSSQQVLSELEDENIVLKKENTIFEKYSGTTRFHAVSNETNTVWNYISDQGEQFVTIFNTGAEKKVLWNGSWALGALSHIKETASITDFIGEDFITTILCTSSGYELIVMDVHDGNIFSRQQINQFPTGIKVSRYEEIFGITLVYEGKNPETFTWSKQFGFAGTPEVSNGFFSTSIGVWLPAGENKVELRIPGGTPLSVCFEEQDGEMVAVWAGIR